MISVGPDRASAGCGGWQSVKGIAQKQPIHGRQGKSAASGRAHMVGRLEFCAPSALRAGWRFSRKSSTISTPRAAVAASSSAICVR